MKQLRIFLLFCFMFCFCFGLIAESYISINGENIPLVDGSREVSANYNDINANIKVYEFKNSINSSINFYQEYFNNNSYQVIGGKKNNSYNAMARKGNVQFSIRIFKTSRGGRLEFIW